MTSRRTTVIATFVILALVIAYLGYELHLQGLRASSSLLAVQRQLQQQEPPPASDEASSPLSPAPAADARVLQWRQHQREQQEQRELEAVSASVWKSNSGSGAGASARLLKHCFVGMAWEVVQPEDDAPPTPPSLSLQAMYDCAAEKQRTFAPSVPLGEIVVPPSASAALSGKTKRATEEWKGASAAYLGLVDAYDRAEKLVTVFDETVAASWARMQHRFALDAALLRVFAVCLGGGGASTRFSLSSASAGVGRRQQEQEQSAFADRWAEIGAALLLASANAHASIAAAVAADPKLPVLLKEQQQGASAGGVHPYFIPLQYADGGDGVSPRRTILHALRSAEYLGIPSLELRGRQAGDVADGADANNVLDVDGAVDSFSLRETQAWRTALETQTLDTVVPAVVAALRGTASSPRSQQQQQQRRPTVLVDLGAGHGGMLAAMCPPHPRLWCYGVDTAQGLVDHGSKFFSHISLRAVAAATSPTSTVSPAPLRAPIAPHLPAGSADAVISNAVLSALRMTDVCRHLEEMVRLLRPASPNATKSSLSVGLIWHLSMTKTNARFAPSFFVDEEAFFVEEAREDKFFPPWTVLPLASSSTSTCAAGGSNASSSGFFDPVYLQRAGAGSSSRRIAAARVLSRCGSQVARYIERIEIVAGDPALPLYTPRFTRNFAYRTAASFGGEFGIRIFRNALPFVFAKSAPRRAAAGKAWTADEIRERAASRAKGGAVAVPLAPKTGSDGGGSLMAPPGLARCFASPAMWSVCRRVARDEWERAFACSKREERATSALDEWCVADVHRLAKRKLKAGLLR